MIHFQTKPVILAAAFLISLSAGCGGNSGGPVLVATRGTIKFDGKPLEKALVVFVPVDSKNGRSASGTTNPEGVYHLWTIVVGDGASPGKYKVSVTARGPEVKAPMEEFPTGLPGATLPGPSLIPEKYFQPDSSGLTAEVKSGGQAIDFELSSK